MEGQQWDRADPDERSLTGYLDDQHPADDDRRDEDQPGNDRNEETLAIRPHAGKIARAPRPGSPL